jgi:hypothetical protein
MILMVDGAGFNIQNIGPKISYDNDQITNFIPANLKFGTGFDFILDDYNKVGLNVEFSKLLVPTPQVGYNGSNYTGTDVNNDGVIDNTDFDLATQEYKSIGWVSGIFKSFGCPEGIKKNGRLPMPLGQNIRIKIHSHCV